MAAVPGTRRRTVAALPFRVERRMLAGILLVGLSVAGGLSLWRGATATTTVLVAAADIQPGQVIHRLQVLLAEQTGRPGGQPVPLCAVFQHKQRFCSLHRN